MARRSRAGYAEVSDVGVIPPVKNLERRERCRNDLAQFMSTYFPHSAGQGPFSDDHLKAIKRIEKCITEGGWFENCFPRGYAKTTISECSALFAIMYAWRRFVVLIGASGGNAIGMLDSIQKELAENDLLFEDFPEICHPIRALEGKAQRCASQHHDGRRTYIEWTTEKIALPMIRESPAGGAVVEVRGITGAIRGLKHKMPDGVQQRPDFAIVDDPQTTISASTDGQVTKRIALVEKDVLKLGGHHKRMACVMNATIIRRGDLADQFADHKIKPAWQSMRIKMMRRKADAHEKLWLSEYFDLRTTYDPLDPDGQKKAWAKATAFYKKNRKAMDAGCEVTWDQCYERDTEISAIQHAYNQLIDTGPEVFASECQNEPLEADAAEDALKVEHLMDKSRFNSLDLGTVPINVTRLLAHIDVMGKLLYWAVVGFDEHFGPTVVAYGTWPDEPRPHFSMRDSRKSIRAATGADSEAAAVQQSVQECIDMIASRQWLNEQGVATPVERIGVDSKWGKYIDEVFAACRQSPHKDITLPTQGHGYGIKDQKRIEDHKPLPGNRQGIGWRLNRNPKACTRGLPWLLIDTNRWKTFLHKAMTTKPGTSGALMFNGKWKKDSREKTMQRHRLLAEHLLSEKPQELEDKKTGRTAVEFTKPPPGQDNHWLDNVTSACAMAAERGVRESTAAPVRQRRYLDVDAALKARDAERASRR